MNNRTFWFGVAVVFVIFQAIGFVVHGLWLDATYQELASAFRPEEQIAGMMPWMWAAGALAVILFGYIFTHGREGTGPMEGVRYGLIMGLFFSVPSAVDQYIIYPLPLNVAMIWAVSGVVAFILGGAAFAAIYKPST